MKEYLSTLNEKQLEAVKETQGPVLILAGAGSGKTRTIIFRIANILKTNLAYPSQILALTFTNKAAMEMKERINHFGIENINDMWMGTFHSICAKILRIHGQKLGYSNSFTIYDEEDGKKIIKQCLEELEISVKEYPPSIIKGYISRAKDSLLSPEDFLAENENNFSLKKVGEVYKLYEEKLKKNNAMDFDDLLFNVCKLLSENEEVLSYYQNKFKYILVDEYQDTNHCQYMIISLIGKKSKNVCVCGDDDQSIYGWRGANIRNILEFEIDFPNCKVIKLEQNYRCTKTILQAANAVIDNNSNRKGKTLWTENDSGEKITYLQAQTDFEEASLISREIISMKRNHDVKYCDIAILYRTNAQSRSIEESLLRHNIPYQIVGGTKFYDRLEIKDIIAYLTLLVNPKDDLSLIRVINTPKRGIGNTTIEKLREYATFKGISLYEASMMIESIPGITKGTKEKILSFVSIMNEIKAHCEEDLGSLVKHTINISGYMNMLKEGKVENAENRMENLNELINGASSFYESSDDTSLNAFLESVCLVSNLDSYDEESGKVLLMTLHNAKGLEFNNVIIPGMEEGIFPLGRCSENEEEFEEERRLCYVGITRAKKKLYLVSSKTRRVYGNMENRRPSRFLLEIPNHLVDQPQEEYTYASNEFKNVSYGSGYNPYKKPTITNTTQNKKSVDISKYNPGDKINHSKWGVGTIVSISGDSDNSIITAAFPGIGIKKFAANIASFTLA